MHKKNKTQGDKIQNRKDHKSYLWAVTIYILKSWTGEFVGDSRIGNNCFRIKESRQFCC